MTVGLCSPDDDGVKALRYVVSTACAKAPPDGGVKLLGDASPLVNACRVIATTDGVAPDCRLGDPAGIDGVACVKSADCAPGFDCVDGERGSTCRRYCCSGSCEGQTSANGGATFCDIQKLVEQNPHKAPVCMPIKKCKLLVPGECGDRETCAIVDNQGDSGCVPKGMAKAGESCDSEHCGADLTCLGSPGDRRCYKLCKTDSAVCGTTQTCTTGALFQDTTFGVCKTP
jgi:hypothetical protein